MSRKAVTVGDQAELVGNVIDVTDDGVIVELNYVGIGKLLEGYWGEPHEVLSGIYVAKDGEKIPMFDELTSGANIGLTFCFDSDTVKVNDDNSS